MKNLQMLKRPAPVRRMRGVGAVRLLAWIPVALVLLLVLVFGFFEGRKAYWDYRVQEMCEKDGGARVYEHEYISRQNAQENGLLIGDILVIPSRPELPTRNGYYIDFESTDLRVGNPKMVRARTSIVRAIDRKVLAEMVSYARVGGDFPTFAHPSVISCREADQALLKFRTAVQIQGEAK